MVIVDIEANGLSPLKNSIVSIGALDFENPTNQFYQECQMWQESLLDYEAMGVCGFSLADITDTKKPRLEEIFLNFLEWIAPLEDKIISGENSSFDRDFLRETAKRCHIPWTFGHRTIDLHSVSFAHAIRRHKISLTKEGTSALNLDATLAYCGLPHEPHPHNALTGAKLEAEAFSRLLYAKNLLKEFSNFSIPEYF